MTRAKMFIPRKDCMDTHFKKGDLVFVTIIENSVVHYAKVGKVVFSNNDFCTVALKCINPITRRVTAMNCDNSEPYTYCTSYNILDYNCHRIMPTSADKNGVLRTRSGASLADLNEMIKKSDKTSEIFGILQEAV